MPCTHLFQEVVRAQQALPVGAELPEVPPVAARREGADSVVFKVKVLLGTGTNAAACSLRDMKGLMS